MGASSSRCVPGQNWVPSASGWMSTSGTKSVKRPRPPSVWKLCKPAPRLLTTAPDITTRGTASQSQSSSKRGIALFTAAFTSAFHALQSLGIWKSQRSRLLCVISWNTYCCSIGSRPASCAARSSLSSRRDTALRVATTRSLGTVQGSTTNPALRIVPAAVDSHAGGALVLARRACAKKAQTSIPAAASETSTA
eukprot:3590111-Prymnesium_polylepis.2